MPVSISGRALPRIITVMVISALLAVAGPTANSGAAASYHHGSSKSIPGTHAHIMLPPTPGHANRFGCPQTGCPPPNALLSYHGGAVTHTVKAYTIFWLPQGYHFEDPYAAGSSPNAGDLRYETLINRFFKDVGKTPYLNILTQYSDTSDQVHNALSFGGAWVDAGALSQFNGGDTGTMEAPLLDSDIQSEVARAMSNHPGWHGGLGTQFFVLTPAGVHSCYSSSKTFCDAEFFNGQGQYCAYHSYFGGGTPILYSNMFNAGYSTACGGPNWTFNGRLLGPIDGPGPNGDPVADYEISPLSHEMAETITDPQPDSGWYDSPNGNEIGDTCAYNFGTLNGDGGNLGLHGHSYLVQSEWSNATQSCTFGYSRESTLGVNTDSDAVPVGGITPLCPTVPGGDSFNPAYSLRCAIGDANNDAVGGGPSHLINFSACTSPCLVTASSTLPNIYAPGLTIDGGTTSALSGNHSVATGLTVKASHVTVRGLTIENFKGDGIDVGAGSTHVILGGSKGDRLISNGRFGVQIGSSPRDAARAVISSSVVYGNLRGGISLNGLGPTHCLSSASSARPNGYIDCPSVSTSKAKLVVGSSSCASCRVEIFSVPNTADVSGHGQALRLVGSGTTTSAGAWSIRPRVSLVRGTFVTATVTNPRLGETSEFAKNHSVS